MTRLSTTMREQAEQPDKSCSHIFRVNSEALGRTVLVSELATIHVDELRALHHEVYCDRQSMFSALESYSDKLQQTSLCEGESKEWIQNKVKQLSKKIAVYTSFYKLIKREVTWRVSLNNVARAKIAIQAKQVGLNDAQINALLDVDNAIHKVFTINKYSRSPSDTKAVTVQDRLDSMKREMFMAELCSILSKEFDEPELAEIRKEAEVNIEKAFNWQQIESMLNEHLPDGNGILKL